MNRNSKTAPSRERTTLEHVILGLLAQHPQSGYDIKGTFESTALRQFSPSPGSIYPALKRLERGGFLSSRMEGGTGDRPRRVYEPTGFGMETLTAWLTGRPSIDELRVDARLPILRFSFFGAGDVEASHVEAFLDDLADAIERYRAELLETAEVLAELADPFPGAALDHGLRGLDASRQWIDRTRLLLEKGMETR